MYGLVLEALVDYIRFTYGEHTWRKIQQHANVDYQSFSSQRIYSENLIPALAQATADVTNTPIRDVMDGLGKRFVQFVGQYGYDRLLSVLGRHLRDFLNGLDNLHEYLKFTYPKMKPPSFFCQDESQSGLTLHYRSRRKGFLHYVKGQIKQVAETFYNTKVVINVLTEETTGDITHVVMRLDFDNTAFKEKAEIHENHCQTLPVAAKDFFDVFPFNIVFDQNMTIKNLGAGMTAVMTNIKGARIDDVFTMTRPLLEFTWESVITHTNNVFQLETKRRVRRSDRQHKLSAAGDAAEDATGDDEKKDKEKSPERRTSDADLVGESLHLKGQMMYLSEWDAIIFLGTPIMENLDKMFNTGLYINDLGMHDSSRDMVLAGTQQSAELRLALDQEQQKSRILEESMRKLDCEMKRTDSLLYQMIPKTVADRLRSGEPAMNTCEVFDSVTILFSDVVGFTSICSKITPLGVVSMLNAMYTTFDQLSERHNVYKVETIGDAYMVVSGAPMVTKYNGLHICNMALDLLDSMCHLKDPSTDGNMKIRVGIHSGNAVAGVVGLKMPRYCLFGDTVNTASRMETTGQAMKIHISETTKRELSPYPYIVDERGTMSIKGKGTMKTYWLLGKDDKEFYKNPIRLTLEEEVQTSLKMKVGATTHNRSLTASSEGYSPYSPVTFEEVAKSMSSIPRSPSLHNSPTKHNNDSINYNHNTNKALTLSNFQHRQTTIKDEIKPLNLTVPAVTVPIGPGTGSFVFPAISTNATATTSLGQDNNSISLPGHHSSRTLTDMKLQEEPVRIHNDINHRTHIVDDEDTESCCYLESQKSSTCTVV